MDSYSGRDLESAGEKIAAEILEVHAHSYGVGAGKVVTHFLEDLVMVWIDDIVLSLAERTLIDGGHTESVLRTRAAFQDAIKPTFVAIVERATGRRVSGFLSTTSLTEMCSVELFRLHPAAG